MTPIVGQSGVLFEGVAFLGGGPLARYQGSRAATRLFTGCVSFEVPLFRVPQVDPLVLDRPLGPFDEHVGEGSAATIHRDGHSVLRIGRPMALS